MFVFCSTIPSSPGPPKTRPWAASISVLRQPVRAVRVERSLRRARGGPNSDNRIALFIRDQKPGRRALTRSIDPAVACERGYGL
jgi:hypothetical protein